MSHGVKKLRLKKFDLGDTTTECDSFLDSVDEKDVKSIDSHLKTDDCIVYIVTYIERVVEE